MGGETADFFFYCWYSKVLADDGIWNYQGAFTISRKTLDLKRSKISMLEFEVGSTPQKHYFFTSNAHFFKPQGPVRPERLGKLKKFFHLIGSRTRDLAACSIVP
jgi:hypothetical protein